MRKSIAVLLMLAVVGLVSANPLFFCGWYYNQGAASSPLSLVLTNYYTFALTSPTTLTTLESTVGGHLQVDMNSNTNLYLTNTPSPAAINGILPWVLLNRTEGGYYTTNWGQYVSSSIQPYRSYNTAASTAAYLTNDNVRPVGTMTNTGVNAVTINSLVLDSATPFTQCRTDFTLLSGGLIINKEIPYLAPTTASSTDFTFPVKGHVWLAEGTESYISFLAGTQPVMSGTNGLVVTGNGQLLFDTYGATSGSGGMYMNQSGDIWLNDGAHLGFAGASPNLLGVSNCTWYLQGGVMVVGADGTVDYDRPVVFRSSNSVVTAYTYLGAAGNVVKKLRSLSVECCKATFEGWGATQILGIPASIVTIKNAMTLLYDTTLVSRFASEYTGNISAFTLQFDGGISGPYGITFEGPQYFGLYGTNTYSGMTYVTNGVVLLTNSSNLLGTAGIDLAKSGGFGKLNITATDVPVKRLYYGGVEQLAGTHGSSSSSATYKEDIHLFSSGTLTVTDGPAAPTEYDLVLGIGQSNMNGMGDTNLSPYTVQGAAWQNSGTSSNLTWLKDPTAAIYGSCVPSFANTWFTNTGRGVIYVYGGGNLGSSLIAAAEPTNRYNWSKSDGDLYTNAVALMNYAIANVPSNYPIANKVVLWIQGEQDGTMINGSNVTAAIYEQELVTLITNLNADITGGIDSFRVSELGATTNGTYESEWASIRTAQSNAVAAVWYASMPFTGAKDFPAQGKMVDNVHYDQTGLNEVGAGLASGGIPSLYWTTTNATVNASFSDWRFYGTGPTTTLWAVFLDMGTAQIVAVKPVNDVGSSDVCDATFIGTGTGVVSLVEASSSGITGTVTKIGANMTELTPVRLDRNY